MATIINRDYFIRDISIPGTNRLTGGASIDSSIEYYEPLALIDVLGYELYQSLLDNPTDQRIVDIIQGKVFQFEFNGKTVTRKYQGLSNDQYNSLIAYYVYFFHQRNLVTQTSNVGEKKAKAQNANNASSYDKLMRAWNNFVKLSGDVTNDNLYDIDCFNSLDNTSYIHMNDDPSLYNFLLANLSVYPEWEYKPNELINFLGI